jgi:predicted nucleotidyltransferase
MDILRKLKQISEEKGIPFLLIGGHALNIYGLSRQTGDIDLLIHDSDHDAWKDILVEAGYLLFHDSPAFMQFSPPTLADWPVDLMLVDIDTFSRMSEQAQESEIDGVKITVPSLIHLMALKLHALNQDSRKGELKDLDDLLGLLETPEVDIYSSDFKDLCFKYASEDIYNKILEQWGKEHND